MSAAFWARLSDHLPAELVDVLRRPPATRHRPAATTRRSAPASRPPTVAESKLAAFIEAHCRDPEWLRDFLFQLKRQSPERQAYLKSILARFSIKVDASEPSFKSTAELSRSFVSRRSH